MYRLTATAMLNSMIASATHCWRPKNVWEAASSPARKLEEIDLAPTILDIPIGLINIPKVKCLKPLEPKGGESALDLAKG